MHGLAGLLLSDENETPPKEGEHIGSNHAPRESPRVSVWHGSGVCGEVTFCEMAKMLVKCQG